MDFFALYFIVLACILVTMMVIALGLAMWSDYKHVRRTRLPRKAEVEE